MADIYIMVLCQKVSTNTALTDIRLYNTFISTLNIISYIPKVYLTKGGDKTIILNVFLEGGKWKISMAVLKHLLPCVTPRVFSMIFVPYTFLFFSLFL